MLIICNTKKLQTDFFLFILKRFEFIAKYKICAYKCIVSKLVKTADFQYIFFFYNFV